MQGDWRDEYAIVYAAAAQHGFTPGQCDQMEIWELASALGANHADEPDDPTVDESGYSFNERRAIALSRGEEPPSWDEIPLSPSEVAGMQKLMGGISPILPEGTGQST